MYFQSPAAVVALTKPNPDSAGALVCVHRSPGCSGDEVRVETIEDREHWLGLAAVQLRAALELLDRVDAPPHIAAQVDLALHQLEQIVDPGLS